MLEHLVTASVLVHQILSMVLNDLDLDDSQQLRFGLWLEEVIGSFFFLEDVLFSFSEVLWTIESAHPTSTLGLVFILALKLIIRNYLLSE